MKAWVREKNKEEGSKLYRVEGLEKPAPKLKPEPVVQAPEEPVTLSLSFVERDIAERTLGCQKGKVSKNEFTPTNDVEQRSVASLVRKGFMKPNGRSFYLTVLGISALDEKRKLLFGEIG